ncbi:MAG: DUF6531 domain-containing protein [Synergistaceae bacterium]|nr:DUF6531 domain-containing protein [Synergistaceae bacterium]
MASALVGASIYLAGGTGYENIYAAHKYMNELYEYITQTEIWIQKASMPLDAARDKTVGAAAGGNFYVIGGATNSSNTATNRVDAYDPASGLWSTGAVLPYSAHSVAAASYNNKVYTFGGRNGNSGAFNYVYEYNPLTNTWAPRTGMLTARYGAAAVELNGKIYVSGGFDGSGNALKTLEVYDPADNSWQTKSNMPEAKGYCGAVADSGIYVIGGSDGYASVNTVYQYNPLADIWFYLPGLDGSVEGVAANAANNGIYIINGYSNSGGSGATPDLIIYVGANYFSPTSSISDYSELVHLGSDIINPSGNLSRSYTDLSYNAPGFTVEAGRTYNSADARDSIISRGWTFSFCSRLEIDGNDTVVRMPDGWEGFPWQ